MEYKQQYQEAGTNGSTVDFENPGKTAQMAAFNSGIVFGINLFLDMHFGDED